jgi:putative transposase
VHSLREILDAIFYIVRSGDVPGDSWRTTSLRGRPSSLLQQMEARGHLGEDARRFAQAGAHEPRSRAQRRRGGQPVAQKHRGVGGEQRGYDGGKKVKGRKRHLLVDTQGLVLKAPSSTARK